jgi:hypothetical protein
MIKKVNNSVRHEIISTNLTNIPIEVTNLAAIPSTQSTELKIAEGDFYR